MLQKLGWKEGEGLGSEGQGIKNPVNKSVQLHGLLACIYKKKTIFIYFKGALYTNQAMLIFAVCIGKTPQKIQNHFQ